MYLKMRHLFQSVYTTFLAPRQKDESIRNRELVLNVLLAGTLLILGLAILVIAGNYLSGRTFVWPRAVALAAVILLVLYMYRLSRRGRYRLAAWALVIVYLLLALFVGMVWSIALPSAVLLYGLLVVMAGILLGPRYSLIGFGVVVLIITATVIAGSTGLITYDLAWKEEGTGSDDIFGLSFMLGMIAAVSWLFNYQMVRSLHRAERAEAALSKQKDMLEITVEERTRELQAVQLEKIQQMYRFAELGQLSTALLHDLSNHLTSLTMDIEGLQGQTRSRLLSRARRSIGYIDDMVVRVRDQLQGKTSVRAFNVIGEIEEVVKMLRHKAQAYDVILKWQPPQDKKAFRTRGEPIRLRQLMANLISNGIDAHYEANGGSERREVLVSVTTDRRNVIISVEDWGRGITPKERERLFEPFFSTKQTGMGMGLYIVKQIVEEHFLGDISIDASKRHTAFVVRLPKASV
jgi:signal transduction histidine kinase